MFSLFKGSKAPKSKTSSKDHHCRSTKASTSWGGHSPDGGWEGKLQTGKQDHKDSGACGGGCGGGCGGSGGCGGGCGAK